MQLDQLCANLDITSVTGSLDVPITGIAYDSREVEEGQVFVAWQGYVHDGHDYLEAALDRGARALVVERPPSQDMGVPVIQVADGRRALPQLAGAFYGYPSHELHLTGITGTNGKTTTTYLVRSILQHTGLQTGLIGTVQNVVGGESLPVKRTTPESLDIARMMRSMVEKGDRAAVMEVSSQALKLHRVDSCEYDVAVFTNLSRDHISEKEHADFAEYRACKGRLFRKLEGAPKQADWTKVAVINVDDPNSDYFVAQCPDQVKILTYGIESDADVTAQGIALAVSGSRFQARIPQGTVTVELGLSGRFNVYNALAAIATGLAYGVDPARAAEALGEVTVPGRFERVDVGQPFAVIVDYAHSPDGLENVLQAAQEVTSGEVIAVFGAGGDRDKKKRPEMGRVACETADRVYITSDNPRSEDPQAIIDDIKAGVTAPAKCTVVVDRAQAIQAAIESAKPQDTIVIAGKGHETYQELGDRTIDFDDRTAARKALETLGF